MKVSLRSSDGSVDGMIERNSHVVEILNHGWRARLDRRWEQTRRPNALMTQPDKWRAWHAVALNHLSSWPPGLLLDLASDEGTVPFHADRLGHRVICSDRDLTRLGFRPAIRLDLNVPLPFPDGTFDYACFLEGIEHLERPFDALSEICRVLRKGGKLILSTPNILNLRSRWNFLTRGYHLRFGRIDPLCRGSAAHLIPLSYRELDYFLRSLGFESTVVETDRSRRKPWLFHQFLRLLDANLSDSKSPYRGVTDRTVLLEGRSLILVAAKRGAPGAARAPG